jgi:uncharacterized protein DUF4416
MGTAKSPAPVKLIAGLLAASDELLAEASAALIQRFGPLDASTEPAAWEVSAYYRRELGATIRRQFVSLERLVAAVELADIKHATNDLENRWRSAAGRQVNIDPGYVATTKLILASTKDAAHRVYLGRGIYAEVTLSFSNGSFRAIASTYPDYATAQACAFFNGVRATYLKQLRELQ